MLNKKKILNNDKYFDFYEHHNYAFQDDKQKIVYIIYYIHIIYVYYTVL